MVEHVNLRFLCRRGANPLFPEIISNFPTVTGPARNSMNRMQCGMVEAFRHSRVRSEEDIFVPFVHLDKCIGQVSKVETEAPRWVLKSKSVDANFHRETPSIALSQTSLPALVQNEGFGKPHKVFFVDARPRKNSF